MKISTVIKTAVAAVVVVAITAIATALIIAYEYHKGMQGIVTVRSENQIYAIVRVNGHVGNFLLDTGAQASLITQDFADKIGLTEPRAESQHGVTVFSMTRLQGVNGSSVASRVVAETFDVGTMPAMKNHSLLVAKMAGFRADGILGMDVLGQYRRIILLKPEQSDGVSVVTVWPDNQ